MGFPYEKFSRILREAIGVQNATLYVHIIAVKEIADESSNNIVYIYSRSNNIVGFAISLRTNLSPGQ